MSTQQMVDELLSLPLSEQADLAQALWQSINGIAGAGVVADEREAITDARRRDAELTSNPAESRSQDEVMTNARGALECA